MKKVYIDHFSVPYTGRRENNGGNVSIEILKKKGTIRAHLMVAEGMGGYEKGDLTSKMVVAQLEKLNRKQLGVTAHQDADIIKREITEINRRIYEEVKAMGVVDQMGTTVSGALIHGNCCLFFIVGDSRTYVISPSGLRQVTRDHSADMDVLDNGIISKGEVGQGYYTHALTRSIGTDLNVETDIFPTGGYRNLSEGEIIFSCTAGLWNVVSDEEIHREIAGRNSLSESLEALAALVYSKGSKDNISMAAYEYGKMPRQEMDLGKYRSMAALLHGGKRKTNLLLPILVAISIVALLAIVFALVKLKNTAKENGNPIKDGKLPPVTTQAPITPAGIFAPSTGKTKPVTTGGKITFSKRDGVYQYPIWIKLSHEELVSSRGIVIPSELYCTTDGREPTKENGKRYRKGNHIPLTRPGVCVGKAKLFPKAGNCKVRVYSQEYRIKKTEPQTTIVTNFNRLDQATRDEIVEKTKEIVFDSPGVEDVKTTGAIKILLYVSLEGEVKIDKIAWFDVIPQEKSDDFKRRLAQEIKLQPPMSNKEPEDVEILIGFKVISKLVNTNKIRLERK